MEDCTHFLTLLSIFTGSIKMKSLGYLLFAYVLSLLSCPLLCGTSSSGDDRRWLVSLVDLVELDYVDSCEQRSTAAWQELIGDNKGLSLKVSS